MHTGRYVTLRNEALTLATEWRERTHDTQREKLDAEATQRVIPST